MEKSRELAKKILKRGYFTQFPFPDNYYTEQVLLWRSVLDLSLVDLIRGPDIFQKYVEDIDEGITWTNLLEWFDTDNDDFQTVCYLAKIEPSIVYRKIDEIINLELIPEYLK